MKNLFISALLLTGAMAMAQEPVKQTSDTIAKKQPAQTTQTTTTKTTEVQPAAKPQPAQQPATVKKTEATMKETQVKKADPAKKS